MIDIPIENFPDFIEKNPKEWVEKIEKFFEANKIMDDNHKFDIVFACCNVNTLPHIILCDTKNYKPFSSKYDKLLNMLLHSFPNKVSFNNNY